MNDTKHVWNNMAFNSDDEMRLAQEIPSAYLDRWNDAGHIAEAILDSDWLAAHDSDVAAKALEEAALSGQFGTHAQAALLRRAERTRDS